MNKSAASVIKHDNVRVVGKVRLDSAMPRMTEPGMTDMGSRAANIAGAAAARIVQTAADHVMIEFTCACGTKTMLRCNY